MNYLPVSVYRDLEIGDCTNGGVTSNPDNYFVVPCEDGHVTEEIVEKRGYIVLEPIAEAACKKYKKKVVALGGVHVDNATKEEINLLVNNCKELLKCI